ncbi:hypothetical protein [Streptomyces sp. NPDC014733]|uniref:hypothetical protein n=1 Tax=Streptomyces sp. NPDC014733 TaxID=3364885 RepID=UPI0036FBE2E2
MQKPYLVGHQEFAALYGVKPQMVAKWLTRGVLDSATAIVISGVRYWPLGFAARYGATTPRPKPVDVQAKERLIAQQGEGWEADLGEELPPIVGQREIVQLFRLPAQGNLSTAIAAGRFVDSDWKLSGSQLWLLDTVIEAGAALRKSAHTVPWEVDEAVAAALREGTYGGPGSRVLTRGPYARTVL